MQDAMKDVIIIYDILVPIPMKALDLVILLCFICRMKLKKCCFNANLDICLEMWRGCPMNLTCVIMVGITSCVNSLNCPKVKLVWVLNKHDIASTVVKMSLHTCVWSTNCMPPSSNFINVKYSQMLMQVITTYSAIGSFSSRNPLSLRRCLKSSYQDLSHKNQEKKKKRMIKKKIKMK